MDQIHRLKNYWPSCHWTLIQFPISPYRMVFWNFRIEFGWVPIWPFNTKSCMLYMVRLLGAILVFQWLTGGLNNYLLGLVWRRQSNSLFQHAQLVSRQNLSVWNTLVSCSLLLCPVHHGKWYLWILLRGSLNLVVKTAYWWLWINFLSLLTSCL